MGVLGSIVHHGFVVPGDSSLWAGQFSRDARHLGPIGGLRALYTRHEVKYVACDSHACSRTLVSMGIHWLHDQFTAIAVPFAVKRQQSPGVDLNIGYLSLCPPHRHVPT